MRFRSFPMEVDLFVRVTVLPRFRRWPRTIGEAKEMAKLRLQFIEVSEKFSRELKKIIQRGAMSGETDE